MTTGLLNPINALRDFWSHRDLLFQLTIREIKGLYRGSYLGMIWSVLTPLFMLAIYTFVFSVVFNARFGTSPDESRLEFALALFCGLIPFNVFTQCISVAPRLIVLNANYVKKVVFPLEILPVSILGRTLFEGLISFAILIGGVAAFVRPPSPAYLALPLVFLPLIFWSLGISWFFASLGVFIRDLAHAVDLLIRILFFLTPIFYPISRVPPTFRFFLHLNPLTLIVGDFRSVIIFGRFPDWSLWGIGVTVSFVAMMTGYWWFMRGKHAFADVL